MRRLLVGLSILVVSVAFRATVQQSDPIKEARDALGESTLKTLRFTGFGASYAVGQSPSPTEPWPRVQIKSYEAAIDYEAVASQIDMTREQGAVQPRGGGAPFLGEQRVIQAVHGNDAWSVAFERPPAPGRGARGDQSGEATSARPPTEGQARVHSNQPTEEQPAAPAGRGRGAAPPAVAQPPQAQPAAAAERSLQIWLTPHGFLKGAAANNATTKALANGTEVSFTVDGKYKIVGLLNKQHLLERVETRIDNPVLGDMPVTVEYSNYKKFDAVFFPTRIVQKQGGYPALDLWLTGVQPNADVDIRVPDPVRGVAPPAPRVELEKIANGIHYLKGGTHHSVAIELADHLVVVEAPLNEARAAAVIAKLKETIPNKPIRFVVNTHHHFDHAGGLRTFVDHGATIVTTEGNQTYYETAWAAPRTIAPDRLGQSKKTPRFQTFTDKTLLGDATRKVEVYRLTNNPHDDNLAVVYLPAEKILIEADAFTPGAAPPATPPAPPQGGQPGPPQPAPSPSAINLYVAIQRLKLDVAQIAALHGPGLATMADLARDIGRGDQ